MNQNDYKIFINGQPVKRSDSTDDLFPDARSKNQKKEELSIFGRPFILNIGKSAIG